MRDKTITVINHGMPNKMITNILLHDSKTYGHITFNGRESKDQYVSSHSSSSHASFFYKSYYVNTIIFI